MNKPDFDWTLVRSFLAVVEHGSLMGAARAVKASQPTLGRHIAELESQLGLVLFERTGRGLVPTERAVQLTQAAQAMDSSASNLWRQARSADAVVQGTVRLAASQPVACMLLPPILMRMREALPGVQVNLVVSNAVSNLLRREADIALRMIRPEQASLTAKRIGQVNVGACAHRDYLHRRGTPARVEDLLDHDLIGSDQSGDFERGAAAMGLPIESARFALRSDDLIAQWAALRLGLGIGFVADYVMRTDSSVLKIVPTLKLPKYPIWLTVHREIRSSARIRTVYDFLASEVAAALST
jgi:DNA-binding transcriptional LysR family regulator